MVQGADGQSYGPVDLATLQQWVMQSRVGQRTMLTDVNNGLQQAAGNVPGLSQLFRQQQSLMQAPGPYQGGVGQFPTPGSANVSLTPYDPARYGGTLPQGGYVDPMAAYAPPKSKVVAILLCFFLGSLGIHNFYLGRTTEGVVELAISILTLGWCAPFIFLYNINEIYLIASDRMPDKYGRPLV